MAQQPNILFITTDHLRYDNIAANGNPHMVTPVLDRLAAEGLSLDAHYVNSPTCMPSRASIWTGRYPQNHRVTCNGVELRKTERTMAHAFADAGYRTMNVGKLHFQCHAAARTAAENREVYAGYGYDVNLLSDEPGCYDDDYIEWVRANDPSQVDNCRVELPGERTGHRDRKPFAGPLELSHPMWIASEAGRLIGEADREQPWFLSAGFYAPHPPLNPPQKYLDLYDPRALPMPLQHREVQGIEGDAWLTVKQYFYAMVSHVDEAVGRLLATLEASGQADNTIVVFTSDHGDALGDYGRIAKGPFNYDSVLHVPCLVRWPGELPAGRRVGAMLEAIDLYPTLCGLSDVDVPVGVKGRDFAATWRGQSDAGRDDVLVEHRQIGPGTAVKTLRDRRWKYFAHHDGREQLFDMAAEHGEATDLADDPAHAGTLAQMRQRMLVRLINAEDDLPPRTWRY